MCPKSTGIHPQQVLLNQGLVSIPTIVKSLKKQGNCHHLFCKRALDHLLNIKYKEVPRHIMHQMILQITNITDVEISFDIGKKVLNYCLKELTVVTGLNCEPCTSSQCFKILEETSFKDKFFAKYENVDISTIACL